ncbi:hypothetical protein DIURU_005512 [Diutina rugosa]|uniref:Sister chromatid cohesion protein n=1 Tax=Diutina rugosa TaxID=5481 RepID=A0A642UK78_DIURU|nr:uncharacterized protein DIURU_005512 [Diutina rugosa]KAA8896999.1 hypothetical protein DIURU_005512 [Diutina rugosa]
MVLEFSEPLIGTVKEPIDTGTLVDRLTRLHKELSSVEPSRESLDEYSSVAKDLANSKLLKHQSPGVVAYTCCCICDILQIHAPDAPYTASQLTSIFKALTSQLSRLGNGPDAPYAPQYEYILRSLTDVESISLITDTGSNASDLIEAMFTTIYHAAARKLDRRLTIKAAGMLAEIVAEAETIPHEVMDMIMAPFSKDPFANDKSINIGFQISVHICESNVDRMQRLVSQYFSEMLYSEGERVESGEKKARKALNRIHHLCEQLWKFVPEILESVMSLLDDELNADDPEIREMATHTLGTIIGSPNYIEAQPVSKVNFFVVYPQVWVSWLSKVTDSSVAVRTAWVDTIDLVMANSNAQASEVWDRLSRCFAKALRDSSDSVRGSAWQALSSMPYRVTRRLIDPSWVDTVLQECRDKNSKIRSTAIAVASETYNQAEENADPNPDLDQIPSELLHLYYINDRLVDAQVDIAWFESIVPLTMATTPRVQRILSVWKNLDPRARDALEASMDRQRQLAPVVSTFIEMGQSNAKNGDVDSERVAKVVNWLSTQLPQEWKPREGLDRLYRKGTPRHWFLLRQCMDPVSSLTTIRQSLTELESKITDPDTRLCVRVLVLRSASIMFNKSNVAEIISSASRSPEARQVLSLMTTKAPTLVESHLDDLWERVRRGETGANLEALYHYAVSRFEFDIDATTVKMLADLSVTGSEDDATNAIKLLALSRKTMAIREVIQRIHPLNPSDPHFTTHLATWAQLVLVESEAVSPYANEVASVLVSILMETQEREDMIDADEVIKQKSLSLRIMVNRLLGLVEDGRYPSRELEAQCKPVMQLLTSLIGHSGEIVPESSANYPTPPSHRQQLRLTAGELILQLAEVPVYDSLVSPTSLRRLTVLLMDKSQDVRQGFLQALNQRVMERKLDRRFIAIGFYTAFETDPELAKQARMWISSLFKRQSSHKWEKTLATVVYFLAHDEKFSEYLEDESGEVTNESLLHGCQYVAIVLRYFIQLIAQQENISLLYYLASRIKQYRDISVDTALYQSRPLPLEARKLYIVAETAQYLLLKWAEQHSWPLTSYPQKIKLDANMFVPMASTEEVHDVITTVFVPESVQQKLDRRKSTKRVRADKPTKAASGARKKARVEAAPLEPSRRSTRHTKQVDYHETTAADDDSDDDDDNDDDDDDY